MNLFTARWLTRSAYQIPGSECVDCLTSLFCVPCAVNQIYQTTKAYGVPSPDAGAENNRGGFTPNASNGCGNHIYACFCCQCAVASAVKQAVGMPWCWAFLCTNLCTARNMIRYQYRIAGQDCMDDTCSPTLVAMASYFCFPWSLCCIVPFFANHIATFLNESELRVKYTNGIPSKYLNPLPQQAGGVPAGTVVTGVAVASPNPMNYPQGAPVQAVPVQGVVYAQK